MLKTSDVIKDVLDDIVESVVKESKTSLDNQLSAGVGINENDVTKMHVSEISVENTTSSCLEKVLKVNKEKNGQSLVSINSAEKNNDCSCQTSSTAIEISSKHQREKQRKLFWKKYSNFLRS